MWRPSVFFFSERNSTDLVRALGICLESLYTDSGGAGSPRSWSAHLLILARRVGETIRIGEEIVLVVLRIVGNQVRLGITAPRDVAVDREEIAERKQREAEILSRAGLCESVASPPPAPVTDAPKRSTLNLGDRAGPAARHR